MSIQEVVSIARLNGGIKQQARKMLGRVHEVKHTMNAKSVLTPYQIQTCAPTAVSTPLKEISSSQTQTTTPT